MFIYSIIYKKGCVVCSVYYSILTFNSVRLLSVAVESLYVLLVEKKSARDSWHIRICCSAQLGCLYYNTVCVQGIQSLFWPAPV